MTKKIPTLQKQKINRDLISHKRFHYTSHYLKETNISYRGLRWLGYVMAFLGGAINAGGFFALMTYTSHMSGELAKIADNIYLSNWSIVISSLLMVVSFILGSAHSSWTIIWSKKNRFRGSYGLSMWIEAFYMLIFGIIGYGLHNTSLIISPTIIIMCFIMGMHNTVMTILSNGIVRSTHMTGHITDIGIELSKLIFNSVLKKDDPKRIAINTPKIKLFSGIIFTFVVGGIIGVIGFDKIGYKFVIPVAIVLLIIGFGSIGYDVKVRLRLFYYKKFIEKKTKNTNTDQNN